MSCIAGFGGRNSYCTLTNNRVVSFLFIHISIQVSPEVWAFCEASDPGTDAMTACGQADMDIPFFLLSVIKMTSKARAAPPRACDRCCGDAGIAIICRREDQKIPFPRVKGGYCGHGLGSLVTCRHLLSVSWRLVTVSGLNIPCPFCGALYRG